MQKTAHLFTLKRNMLRFSLNISIIVIDIPTIPIRLATIIVERLLSLPIILGAVKVPMIKPTDGIPLIIAL